MSNSSLKQVRNALAIGGLAAMVSGCVVSQPNGRGGMNSLFLPAEVFQGIYDGISVKNNQQSQQHIVQQNYVSGPVEASRPLGRTKYSYPFLQYSGSGNSVTPENFLHKRSVISLSESPIVYFGTSWNAFDGKGLWSVGRTSTRFYAWDMNGNEIASSPRKLDEQFGERVNWFGLSREILAKAGNQIKVGFIVRHGPNDEKSNLKEQDDVYIVPIVP